MMDSLRGEGFRGRIGARGSQRKKEKGSSVGRMGLGESEELSGMTECPAAWCHPFEWSPLCHQTCVLLCAEDPSPITVGRSTGDHQADHCSPLLGDESRGQRLGLPSTFHHQPDPENQSDLSSNSTHTAHLGHAHVLVIREAGRRGVLPGLSRGDCGRWGAKGRLQTSVLGWGGRRQAPSTQSLLPPGISRETGLGPWHAPFHLSFPQMHI